MADSNAPPVIAVVGAFSRGKSALVNALIETPVPFLPVHPLPTTAVPTRIAYSNTPEARLVYSDHEQAIAVVDVATIAAYRGVIDGLCEIQIGWPCTLLKRGLVLLDTPGIEALTPLPPLPSYGKGADDIAALLFVFAADPPLGDAELDFLREIAPSVQHIILVQSKCDTLAESALQQATVFNRAAVDATCPDLADSPIHSVSALTGAGIAELRDMLSGWDVDLLRQERDAWQMEAVRAQAQHLRDALQVERSRLDKRNAVFKAAQDRCIGDLNTIHAGALATLARLSEYTLGNLSAIVYQVDPVELGGARGLTLANNELRHARDQLVGEIERALIESRRQLIESLASAGLQTGSIPQVPAITLPDPQLQTVAVRVTERRAFRPKQVDALPTINAYRNAVAHMTDTYAVQLLPPLESFLDGYNERLMNALTMINADLDSTAVKFSLFD